MEYKTKKEDPTTSCLECGKTVNGRKDKKFCCLSCKNSYNNRKHKAIEDYKIGTLRCLSRNYEILQMLISENKDHISREELRKLGFNDQYITGHRLGKRKHEECSCFDIEYCRTATKIFHIHRVSLSEF